MKLHGNSKKRLESMIENKKTALINLSITDEYPYAQVILTIESK